MIELRSDTFTLPTAEMLRAATVSELGDDVWGEDPTVIALEEMAASLMGKERALFVASGTMGNLLAILSHTKRGDEVVVGNKSHIFNAEAAGSAVIGGVQLRTVHNTPRGTLDLPELASAIRPLDIHYPRTALICLENSHNQCGGCVLDTDDIEQVRQIADDAGAALHMDGARIFNAAVALDIPVNELVSAADSVTFCLSKGLSAPIGSLLCGNSEFIEQARKYRKMVGGGMRQVGLIAAPGIVALETMVARLAEDHQNAKRLAQALSSIPGVYINLDTLKTNIIVADFQGTGKDALDIVDMLDERGIKIAAVGPHQVRLVTHRNVSADDIEVAIEALREVLQPEILQPA